MNIEALKKRLEKKERDLQADLTLHEAEGHGDARAEVNERGIDSEDSEEQFQQATSDSKLVAEVREALARIEHGTYGKCIDCGRRIEPARLQAIPWTPYALTIRTGTTACPVKTAIQRFDAPKYGIEQQCDRVTRVALRSKQAASSDAVKGFSDPLLGSP